MSSVVPEGWSRQKLGDSLIPRPKSKLPSGESHPLGYYDFYVCSHKVLKSFHNEYSSPSILFSTGGEASVHLATERYAFSTDVWATEFEGEICNEYVFRLLEENIRTINYSGFQGSGIKHLDKSFIEKLEFSIPPLPEQKKIASILTSVDEVIENTQQQIDKLQDLKKATMNELLTKGIGHTEFKDSEMGRIPKSWDFTSIKDILFSKIRDFGSFSSTKLIDFVDKGVPFIKSESVKNGRIDFDSISYITKEVHQILDKSFVKDKTILFTKIGAIGRVAVYRGEMGICNSNAATAKIEIDESKADIAYVAYQLGSERVITEFEKSIISTPPRINLGEINMMKILLPSLEEQQKIASILTTMDKTIEERQRKLYQTQSLKKSLMQDLLTGKARVTVN